MRRMNLVSIVMLMIISLIMVGCSNSTPGESKEKTTKLSMYLKVEELPLQEVYKEIVNDFTSENPEIEIDLQFPGVEYENMLKIKMSANDLPDIFDTHGWAVMRYGDYLADLKDESWADDISDSVIDFVSDETGKVFALPISTSVDGFTYNAELLEKYDIEVPKTWDELMKASEEIVEKSNGETAPIFMSAVDDWTIGQYFDYFANSHLVSPEVNEVEALTDATFDWGKWTPIAESLLELKEKGFINEDVLTAKFSDVPKAFADEKVAFVMAGPYFINDAYEINPDLQVGIMPVPAVVEGDMPNFSGGEKYALGVWKDTGNMEEAKKVVDFFAKTENMEKVALASKHPSGMNGVEAEHEFTKYYNEYADIRVFQYFDRVLLPNGMWDVMSKTGAELISGSIKPEDVSKTMEQEYNRLNSK